MRYLHALLVLIISIAYSLSSFSQGFKVKEFKLDIRDGSAFHAPMDAYGHPCGLVKVRTDNGELKFKGNVVGEVENKTNEYWVYMAQGSKLLNILHPNFLPITVDFSSFGIDEVASKATYILTLNEQIFKKEKCGLVTTVKPETASLFINDMLIENISGNGLYQLYLPKGDYFCRIEQKGYRPIVQAITIGKGTQNLNIELESVMAELEVKCKTSTAEIFVDGEKKGNGSWKGTIFAGEHQIEARQQNHESNSQNISIAEKESRTLVIPELKRSMLMLRIGTTPNNLPVSVDGKSVGMSPCMIEIETGYHYVNCKAFGCLPFRKEIQIKGEKESQINIEMEFSNNRNWLVDTDTYKKAYGGDEDAILELAITCAHLEDSKRVSDYHWQNENYFEEAIFWFNRYPHHVKISDNVTVYELLEILGDCCNAKGNKELAIKSYEYCLQSFHEEDDRRVEKKLIDLKQ